MKRYDVGKYVCFAFLGLLILAAGIAIILFAKGDAEGIMKTLPYVCIGVGCGILGGNTGTAIQNSILRKNPQASKTAEIETNDERNIAIRNKAKAKAYDLMVIVFGALMLAFALVNVDMYITLALVAAYLFVIGANVYFHVKYGKEM